MYFKFKSTLNAKSKILYLNWMLDFSYLRLAPSRVWGWARYEWFGPGPLLQIQNPDLITPDQNQQRAQQCDASSVEQIHY